jgi:hypothetical protein
MTRTPLCVAVFCTFLCASFCSAAVFQHDWKTPGDGLLTYDNVNQREWLDLTQTVLADQFAFTTIGQETKFQYVLIQTAPGGVYEGFSAAKSADVVAFAQSSGINTSTQSFATNSAPTLNLCDLLGYTITHNDRSRTTDGLLNEFDPNLGGRSSAIFNTVFSSQSGLFIGAGQFQFPSPPGVMLYRAAIPEPRAIALMMLCSIEVVCRRGGWRL